MAVVRATTHGTSSAVCGPGLTVAIHARIHSPNRSLCGVRVATAPRRSTTGSDTEEVRCRSAVGLDSRRLDRTAAIGRGAVLLRLRIRSSLSPQATHACAGLRGDSATLPLLVLGATTGRRREARRLLSLPGCCDGVRVRGTHRSTPGGSVDMARSRRRARRSGGPFSDLGSDHGLRRPRRCRQPCQP
jgi:hypothetical protein